MASAPRGSGDSGEPSGGGTVLVKEIVRYVDVGVLACVRERTLWIINHKKWAGENQCRS